MAKTRAASKAKRPTRSLPRAATAVRFFVAGSLTTSNWHDVVLDKYTGRELTIVAVPSRRHVERAIEFGVNAEAAARGMPAFQRSHALKQLANAIESERKSFERLLCAEAGKTASDSRSEVDRALITCRVAAEEATRIVGEYQPLDISPRSAGHAAIVKRVPVGLCSFITPFNFPLNLVMHKVAPAIACGCPFILKPAPQTPLTALMLGDLLMRLDLPQGFFSILPARVEDASPLVEDDRIKLLSFTGSAAVGWKLKANAGKKKVVLELGGNAACIVDADVNVGHAADRITFGAFYQSGQSCISVQRLLVHRSVYDRMKKELVKRAKSLTIGDPKRESTFIGPLISEHDADRVLEWIAEAKRGGGRILCGGGKLRTKHSRAFVQPTIVENPPRDSRLWKEEIFGPVLTLDAFEDFEDALTTANDSRYGLQSGVFTNNLHNAYLAWDRLKVGGVIINDVPSFRVDSMPYGGVKDSGLGREGIRWAIAEMTEPRAMVFRS